MPWTGNILATYLAHHRRMEREIVAYLRVSTKEQGLEGLGIAAQRATVTAFGARNGCPVVAWYEEVETGRKDGLANRPQLVRAVAHARRSSAMLVIARIDRLARSVFVTAQLLRSGVEFIACDNPHASRLTIHILAAMAEHESHLISERVKAALAAARARGRVFKAARQLTPEERRRGQLAAGRASTARAREAYADLLPAVREMRENGATLRAIAARLDAQGQRTSRGGTWNSATVYRLLRREGLTHLKSTPRVRAPVPESVQRVGTYLAGTERTARAHMAYLPVLPLVRSLHDHGRSASEIAASLNRRGRRTQRGSLWSNATVLALLRREAIIPAAVAVGRRCFAPGIRERGVAAAAAIRRKRSKAHAHRIRGLIDNLCSSGATLVAIAEMLNKAGHRTVTGKVWTPGGLARFNASKHCSIH